MSAFLNLRIGLRLALGFGLLLSLTAAVLAFAASEMGALREDVRQLVQRDWASAQAAALVDSTTRANARRTMELFVTDDAAGQAALRGHIARNKGVIDQALKTMDGLTTDTVGRDALAALVAQRKLFVASFSKVDELLKSGQRDAAQAWLLKDTLPAIDQLQKHVKTVSDLQQARAAAAAERNDKSLQKELLILGVVGVALLVLGALIAWHLARGITTPLAEAVQVAQAVASGRLDTAIPVRSNDETGQLMRALQTMTAQLAKLVGSVRQGSENIATGASQIATGTADLSQRTEEQAANLQETAATMEQLASTVRQSAETAGEATRLAQQASAAAVQGGNVVDRVVVTMEGISTASQRITDIIAVIDGIAFQTNILSLNAAVEAARAGEQGRGFAVVAGEVRALAQRSATAAHEIKALIQASSDSVQGGRQLAAEAGHAMHGMVKQVQAVSTLIAQISQAAEQQTQDIGQVNDAVTQLDQVTQQNAALVEQSAAASDSLRHQAVSLVDAVRVFQIGNANTVG